MHVLFEGDEAFLTAHVKQSKVIAARHCPDNIQAGMRGRRLAVHKPARRGHRRIAEAVQCRHIDSTRRVHARAMGWADPWGPSQLVMCSGVVPLTLQHNPHLHHTGLSPHPACTPVHHPTTHQWFILPHTRMHNLRRHSIYGVQTSGGSWRSPGSKRRPHLPP
jgi:hypothetical protein